jgi:hypothetical protein
VFEQLELGQSTTTHNTQDTTRHTASDLAHTHTHTHTHTAAPSGPHPEALLGVVLEHLQDVELVVVVRDVRLTAETNEKKKTTKNEERRRHESAINSQ